MLLSGGASALMAVPAAGLTLADKQATTRQLLRAGADIHALNTVRKHLSAIKGGWLAAAAPGACRTFAISDVVGDDLSVIGSGPTVPDASTFRDALGHPPAIRRRRGRCVPARGAANASARGVRGDVPETPKPDDARLSRAVMSVIGGRRDAMDGAVAAAASRGYHVIRIDDAVSATRGPSAVSHLRAALARAADVGRPACIVSSGETTVRVTGDGNGGRNQEFALACAACRWRPLGAPAMLASVGTDGIDGPTDAAGAIVDATTLDRARARPARSGCISRPERHLSLFRGTRRPRSHGTDRHECRRSPSISVSLNSDVFSRPSARADARACAPSRRHARAAAGCSKFRATSARRSSATSSRSSRRAISSRSAAIGSACPKRWTCTSAALQTHPAGYGFVVPERPLESARRRHLHLRPASQRGDARRPRRRAHRARSRTAAASKAGSSASSSAATQSIVGRYDRDDTGMGYVVPFDRRVLMDILVPPGQEGGAAPGEMVTVGDHAVADVDARRARPRRRRARRHRRARRRHRDHHPQVRHPRRARPEAVAEAMRLGAAVSREGHQRAHRLPATSRPSPSTASTRAISTMRSRSRGCRTATTGSACTSPTSRTTCRRAARSIAKPTSAATSVYFPERAVHMFPSELSTGLCSLNPHVDRLVQSCLMEVDRARPGRPRTSSTTA